MTDGSDRTTRPGAADHLTLDQLADHAEDLLSSTEAAGVRSHLDGCAACAEAFGALGDVSALLASSAPVTMPLDVARRIDAALLDEARLRQDTASALPAAAGSSAVGSIAAARARRHGSTRIRRTAAALVGVAAVLGGGFLFGDALLAIGGDDSADMFDSPESAGDTAGSSGEAPTTTLAGAAYTAAGLPAQIADLIAQSDAARVPGGGPAPSVSGGEGAVTDSDDPRLAAGTGRCVDAVSSRAGTSEAPLAVDVGTYDGLPAVVVVLPQPGADADVWVVGTSCLDASGTGLDVLDRTVLEDVPAAE